MPTNSVQPPKHPQRVVYLSADAFQSGNVLQLSRAMVFFENLSPFEMCHSIMLCHAGNPPFGINWIYLVLRGIFTKLLLLENKTGQRPRFPRVICHDTHPDNTTQNKPPVSPHASITPLIIRA